MTVGSLFAGIGGFDLGLERAGMTVRWQVEIDPFCRAVLAKHWPDVRRYEDVRTVGAGTLDRVDVVCGGFPCQPFSQASRGRRHGSADPRALWPEMRRLVAALRPTWTLAENVVQFDRGPLDAMVSDLEALGYEVAALEVPACAFGLDHWRPRLWILGHAHGDGQPRLSVDAEVARLPEPRDDGGRLGAPDGLSGRLDRRRMAALGNSIVPQIAEWIGRRLLEADRGVSHVDA
jgi:DNA (cytosine-5)-methyltransferase 1